MEEQIEIQRLFRQSQEKFVYYLDALCVTAIGFAIYSSSEKAISWIQIPLGMSVILWSLSIYCGFKFIGYQLSSLYANNTLLDVQLGNHPETGNHPEKILAASEGIKQAILKNGASCYRYGKWQLRLFYFGIISYIIWHIIEMVNNS